MVGAFKARVAPFNVNYRYVDDELLYLFDNGNDHIYGEGGNDSLVGGNGDDSVTADRGDDTLFLGVHALESYVLTPWLVGDRVAQGDRRGKQIRDEAGVRAFDERVRSAPKNA